jgi:hypothetical protein
MQLALFAEKNKWNLEYRLSRKSVHIVRGK